MTIEGRVPLLLPTSPMASDISIALAPIDSVDEIWSKIGIRKGI